PAGADVDEPVLRPARPVLGDEEHRAGHPRATGGVSPRGPGTAGGGRGPGPRRGGGDLPRGVTAEEGRAAAAAVRPGRLANPDGPSEDGGGGVRDGGGLGLLLLVLHRPADEKQAPGLPAAHRHCRCRAAGVERRTVGGPPDDPALPYGAVPPGAAVSGARSTVA